MNDEQQNQDLKVTAPESKVSFFKATRGKSVFLAIAIHKLPEAFSLSSILLHEQYKRSQIVLMHLLFISMIPLGAMAVNLLSLRADSHVAAYAMAFSAGTFIQIAVSDLLPEVHKAEKGRLLNTLLFLLGIVLMALGHH